MPKSSNLGGIDPSNLRYKRLQIRESRSAPPYLVREMLFTVRFAIV